MLRIDSIQISALVLGAALSLPAWSFEGTSADAAGIIQLQPDQLQWKSSPKLHGLQTAVVAGNPNEPGPYAERIRFPTHFRLEPHSHPNEARMVTVLAGTLYYAYGDKFDESKLTAMPPGSFFTEPANLPHYALTKDEEVILQLNAIGPAATKYVEAAAEAK